jgi:hypothetical protein|uniref:hypothetical protein n=1 Tax=Agathobacter rectalis TaxID=39491 RepID=UPI004027C27E
MIIDMFNSQVIVPDDYIIIDETLDAGAMYAGVVAEKYNTLPHCVFFSSKPINQFNAADEERIYALCGKKNPDIADVHKKEVEAIFINGRFINAEEWDKSKRLGIFQIPKINNKNKLYLKLVGVLRGEKDDEQL